jgi:uncharacterized protein with PQ loop repeat
MATGDIFNRKRRHTKTPKYAMLIITNFAVCGALFTLTTKLNWFFILSLVLLGVYNYYTIRRNIDEYNKPVIIANVVTFAAIVLLYFVARSAV